MNADTDEAELKELAEGHAQFMETGGRTTDDVARDLVARALIDLGGDAYTRTGEIAASLQNDDVPDPTSRDLQHLVYDLEELLARVEDMKAILADK